ncbi:Uncharacterized protein FKW44_001983 [Caligus rogercresseyi]|uniref:Uncharacterized protein n=1 Tax=Caligus rogercresseyi TaxID=217165 RepID=A0A7T8KJK5_CALRO|nr:Uncharacterized protein FKW44_001983 [Caligus rogercresseyi]
MNSPIHSIHERLAIQSEAMLKEEEKSLADSMNSLMFSLDISSSRSKMKRITCLLHELQNLSKVCEDIQESCKENRVLQLKTELEDVKDILYTLVESRLSPRQLNPFDPSIRFFGIDWEAIFGRCFNVSISICVFSSSFTSQGASLDIVLLNSIFSHLSRIEAEMDSHAEANRLKTIQTLPRPLTKAKSFRETSESKRVLNLGVRHRESQSDLGYAPDFAVKRKNSFLQNVSNMFKNIR